jgi:hypothetical protein
MKLERHLPSPIFVVPRPRSAANAVRIVKASGIGYTVCSQSRGGTLSLRRNWRRNNRPVPAAPIRAGHASESLHRFRVPPGSDSGSRWTRGRPGESVSEGGGERPRQDYPAPPRRASRASPPPPLFTVSSDAAGARPRQQQARRSVQLPVHDSDSESCVDGQRRPAVCTVRLGLSRPGAQLFFKLACLGQAGPGGAG